MIINQTSIRNTKKLLTDIKNDQKFMLGLEISRKIENIIKSKLNYSLNNLNNSSTTISLFPSSTLGINAMRNADGEYLPDKSKNKETAYRAHEYSLIGFDGKTYSGTCYVSYERYPKIFIPPYELKLVISEQNNTKYIYVYKEFNKVSSKDNDIKFAANLMLEIFGEVDTLILDDNSEFIKNIPVEKVNWEILPSGSQVWNKIKQILINSNQIPKSERTLIYDRIQWLQSKNPTSIKEGLGGYTGYLVFEFKTQSKKIYIIDSIMYGKATYIFENDWKTVSKLTKKEIIQDELAKDRIIHNNKWEENVSKYIG